MLRYCAAGGCYALILVTKGAKPVRTCTRHRGQDELVELDEQRIARVCGEFGMEAADVKSFDYMTMKPLQLPGSTPRGELMRPIQDFGAPEDCQLVPFDCVMLEQSIRKYGNEPPAWIVAASRAWLRARGLTPMHLRPAVSE